MPKRGLPPLNMKECSNCSFVVFSIIVDRRLDYPANPEYPKGDKCPECGGNLTEIKGIKYKGE